jgi:phosphoserine phosphatase
VSLLIDEAGSPKFRAPQPRDLMSGLMSSSLLLTNNQKTSVLTMAGESGQPAGINDKNAVVQLFSKGPIDRKTWSNIKHKFAETIGVPRDAHQAAMSFLDGSQTDQEDPSASRVLAFQVSIPPDPRSQDLTLAQCHRLRVSPSIQDLEIALNVECIVRPLNLCKQHRAPGLAVFDMDSTLIQQEVIDELARSVGRYEQVAAITEAAMRGELDFEASLRARVASLEGVPSDIWETLKRDAITFTPGAHELVKFLRRMGWKTAVLSGGFTPLAHWVKETLGLDYAYANELAVDDSTSTLSGELKPGAPIIGAAMKQELLLKLAQENEVAVERTIAVGDGSNDLLMMGAAGLGIAFNAKPKVQEAAPARLNGGTLLDVAFVLGYSEEEISKILETNSTPRAWDA